MNPPEPEKPNLDDVPDFKEFSLSNSSCRGMPLESPKVRISLGADQRDAALRDPAQVAAEEAERERQRLAALSIQKQQQRRKEREEQRKANDPLKLSTDTRFSNLTPTWDTCGGQSIENLLEHVSLIDAEYLIELADTNVPLPRHQVIPRDKKIMKADLARLRCWAAPNSLPILILSYPWLEMDHPDPSGWLLRCIAPVLRMLLKQAKSFGHDAAIGVMVDFGSLPQHGPATKRTADEERIFKLGPRRWWLKHPI